jgi:two-component system, OmpR family, sensor kinase
MTIRKRLALWYSGLLTLLIISFGIAVITVSRVTLLQTVDQVLAGAARNIASIIDTIPLETDASVEIVYHDEQVFHSPGISIQVWRTHENGEPINPVLERFSGIMGEDGKPLDSTLVNVHEISFNSNVINGVPERVVALPFHTKDGLPLGQIQIATPLHAIANANDQLLLITAISAAIVIAVSIGLGLWLSRHLLKPIEAVKEAAASVAQAQDLSRRLEWSGAKDELGELSEVFNHMMERLEHLFSVQQRFIGDVSHELRTPLTSIIGNLELMERYGMDKESLDAAQREADRMNRMVNDLLMLTRADVGELQVDLYPIDLDRIVLNVYEQALGLAKKRQLNISLERIEPVHIQGNNDRIHQLLLNLISNAIKFTKDGGKIDISVYPKGEEAIVEVRDTGIGISDADKKHIFDRFFRADAAREHKYENDGAGLGLSIARWIADVHGGTIDVESQLGEGTLFRLHLPVKGKSKSDGEITEALKKSITIKTKAKV